MKNRITLDPVPFTERDSRLLVFRCGTAGLWIGLAEYEIDVRQHAPIPAWHFTDAAGQPLACTFTTYPHQLLCRTPAGTFRVTFVDAETLLIALPAGRSGIILHTAMEQAQTDGRGGVLRRAGISPCSLGYTTSAALLQNEIHARPAGGQEIRLSFDAPDGAALLLTLTRSSDVQRDIPAPDLALAASEQRWHAWFAAAPPVAEEYRRQYYYAWWVLRANLLYPYAHPEREGMVPSRLGYVGIWHWDAYFHAIALRRIDSKLAQDQIRIMLDHLLEAGITPFVTLYHWDLPQRLQDNGDGWLRRGLIDDFARYTDVVSRALGDRVRYWTTFNEPCVFTWGGYVIGEDAPGWQRSPAAALTAIHHMFLAHGAATQVLRANVARGQVGIVLDLNVAEPASDAPEDIAAANRFDGFQNRWFLDPLFHGRYPADMLELFREYMPAIQDGDMQQIQVPLDYLGINCYRRSVIAHGTELPPVNYRRISPPGEYTAMGWETYPRALYDILKYVHERYHPPALYITENGAACHDVVSPAGYVHDEQRVRYLREHLAQAQRALVEGVPLAGYFVWSLLDNFEWAYGYSKRFGIVYVDYETQQRLIKDSGYFLAEMIAGKATGQYTATD